MTILINKEPTYNAKENYTLMKATRNIQLRALRYSDIQLLYEWVNDPEIVKYTYSFHPVSEMEHEEWFDSLSQLKSKVLFGIEVKEGERLIILIIRSF